MNYSRKIQEEPGLLLLLLETSWNFWGEQALNALLIETALGQHTTDRLGSCQVNLVAEEIHQTHELFQENPRRTWIIIVIMENQGGLWGEQALNALLIETALS